MVFRGIKDPVGDWAPYVRSYLQVALRYVEVEERFILLRSQ